MWRRSTDRLLSLALLAALACGERPGDSGGGEVLYLLGDGGSLGLSATLEVEGYGADPAADVNIGWPALSRDPLGLPVAEVVELRMWAFADLSQAELAAGLVADALDASSLLTQYSCEPRAQACSFSELEVFGHDYDVREDFGVLDATWLITLHGAGRRGLQGLGFIEPGAGDQVELDDGSAELTFQVLSGQPLELPVGGSPTLDWSGLDTDARGQALVAYRLDLLGLFHLPVPHGEVEATLAAQGLVGATAWWLDVSGGDSAVLAEVEGDEPFTGLVAEGTWLLGLFESSSISPLPRVLVALEPR